MGTQVWVIVAGIYNGPGQRALPWAEPGTVIEVADAEYAGRLAAAGMVEADDGRQTTDDGGQSSDDLGPSATQVGPGPRAKKRKTG